MADEDNSANPSAPSLPLLASGDGVKRESMASTPVIPNGSRVALAPAHQLPTHLIQLLEEWHKDHPNERPLASFPKRNPIDEGRTFTVLSRDRKQYPLVEEIIITKPISYMVYYLPIGDGKQTGILVKPLPWGSRVCFIKKWLGGHIFEARPVAVRLMLVQGSFGEFPDDDMWRRATEKKLPNELKDEEEEQSVRSSVPRKRSREERESTSSSGEDIYPEIHRRTTRQQHHQQQRARSSHVRSSVGGLRDVSNGDGSEGEDEPPPTGLSNGGLPIISRSATHMQRNLASRTSLPHTVHGGGGGVSALLTSPLMISAPSTTTSDSGVDITAASAATTSHPMLNSTSPAIIIFKLRIPRTRMERHIRIEDRDQNADELFKETRDYFRRHDRLIGTPILECVIEDEPDCRCIYNAKELRYFIEELRERRGIIKVTVTQSS